MTHAQEIVVGDIGGTHARYAVAEIVDRRVVKLSEPVTLLARDHISLAASWAAFGRMLGRNLPRAVALAVASPVAGEVLKFTNSPWVIRPAALQQELGVDAVTLVNDFGAVGHALSALLPEHYSHLAGPDQDLPENGVITVIGPGTGLGVAHVLRRGGQAHVIECEGGHIDYAPLDTVEDAILARLRQRFTRVSAERIVSGPGLLNLYEALAAIEGRPVMVRDDKALWALAVSGGDSLATAALQRFCLGLGAVAGDLALAQGANAVVVAGGIVPRIAGMLPNSGFAHRFVAKGRFEMMMAGMPIKLITYPHPGLLGAAAAFAAAACT
jgi:glucokinase